MPSRITCVASSRGALAVRVLDAQDELAAVRRAYSQQNSAVRTPPMCSKPVGLGAKRVRTVMGEK